MDEFEERMEKVKKLAGHVRNASPREMADFWKDYDKTSQEVLFAISEDATSLAEVRLYLQPLIGGGGLDKVIFGNPAHDDPSTARTTEARRREQFETNLSLVVAAFERAEQMRGKPNRYDGTYEDEDEDDGLD